MKNKSLDLNFILQSLLFLFTSIFLVYLLQEKAMSPLSIKIGYVLLFILTIKFILDVKTLGIGFSSLSLALLYTPILCLILFGPFGQITNRINYGTHYVEMYFPLMVFGMIYFYYIWYLLLHIGKKDFSFDLNYLGKIRRLNKNSVTTWVFSIISIIAVIIFLPVIPGGVYMDRVVNLFSGKGWGALAIASYFFVFVGRRGFLRNISLVFVPLWFILHYSRVEIIGLFALLFIYLVYRQDKSVKKLVKTKLFRYALVVFVILLFSYIGFIRGTGDALDSTKIIPAIISLINYPTVQDITYTFAESIAYTELFGFKYTLINYPLQLFPSFLVKLQPYASEIVQNFTVSANIFGGLIIPAEFYINFGFFGLLVAPFLTYFIIFFPFYIIQKIFGDIGEAFSYYILVVYIFRTFWYGFQYYLKALILIGGILLLVNLVISPFLRNHD